MVIHAMKAQNFTRVSTECQPGRHRSAASRLQNLEILPLCNQRTTPGSEIRGPGRGDGGGNVPNVTHCPQPTNDSAELFCEPNVQDVNLRFFEDMI